MNKVLVQREKGEGCGKTETEREEKVESRKEIGRERDEKKAGNTNPIYRMCVS